MIKRLSPDELNDALSGRSITLFTTPADGEVVVHGVEAAEGSVEIDYDYWPDVVDGSET